VRLDVRLVGKLCPRLEKLLFRVWCQGLPLTTDETAVRLPSYFPNLLVLRLFGFNWRNEGKLLVQVLLLYQHSGLLKADLTGPSVPQDFLITSLYLTVPINFLIISTLLTFSCELHLSALEGIQILAG
jgi:hypothetical protein